MIIKILFYMFVSFITVCQIQRLGKTRLHSAWCVCVRVRVCVCVWDKSVCETAVAHFRGPWQNSNGTTEEESKNAPREAVSRARYVTGTCRTQDSWINVWTDVLCSLNTHYNTNLYVSTTETAVLTYKLVLQYVSKHFVMSSFKIIKYALSEL